MLNKASGENDFSVIGNEGLNINNKRKQTERAVVRKQDKSGAASAPSKVITNRKKINPAPKERQITTKAKVRKHDNKDEEFKIPLGKYNEYDHEMAIIKCRDQQKELQDKLKEIDEKSKAREIEKHKVIAKLEAQRIEIYNKEDTSPNDTTEDLSGKSRRKKWNKNSNIVDLSGHSSKHKNGK